MLTLITLFFLAILILGHEAGHFFAAKILKIQVDEFGIGFPPKIFSKVWRGTKYSLNLLPLGGFVRIKGEDGQDASKGSFAAQTYWKKTFVILSGVLMNILIGWIAFSSVLLSGIPQGVLIESVASGSPAEAVGFVSGDILKDFESTEELIKFVEANKGKEVVIDGKKITPRATFPEGEGSLGIVISDIGAPKQNIGNAIKNGFLMTFETIWMIFKALGAFLWGVLSGNFAVMSDVSGPVGVFQVVKNAASLGAVYFIQLLGLISINLAALNVIPFPALDGGRMLVLSLQKVFGEKIISKKAELVVNVAGFAFLILLMIAVTVKDIINLS